MKILYKIEIIKKILFLLLFIAFQLPLHGCTKSPKPLSSYKPLSAHEIADIARNYVRDREKTWSASQIDVEIIKKDEKNNWVIIIWRVPRIFEGSRFIYMDDMGKVIEYSNIIPLLE